MRKIIFSALAFMCTMTALADDFNLYYDSAEGAQNMKIEAVANIKKIVFEDGKIVAVLTDGTKKETPINDVKRLYFNTESAVSIEGIKEESIGKKGIYDLTGRALNLDINKNKLPKGIYIVDGKKVMVK